MEIGSKANTERVIKQTFKGRFRYLKPDVKGKKAKTLRHLSEGHKRLKVA